MACLREGGSGGDRVLPVVLSSSLSCARCRDVRRALVYPMTCRNQLMQPFWPLAFATPVPALKALFDHSDWMRHLLPLENST